MQFIKSNIKNFLPHLVAILFILLLPEVIYDKTDKMMQFWRTSYYYQMSFMIVAFYVNYLVIVPKFYFNNKKATFIIVLFLFVLLLLVAFQLLFSYVEAFHIPEKMAKANQERMDNRPFKIHPRLIDNFFMLVFVLAASTGAAIIRHAKQNENVQKEKEKAHLDIELAFLKNQISPHFFFNALNNIYALIAIDSEKAQLSVEKLSGLMRYLIYDSDIKMVEGIKEFEFTRLYIDLMQQRINSKVTLDVDIDQNNINFFIPPLLFVPFIENAFKHGISYREKSFISIRLHAQENKIVFACENSIPLNGKTEESKKGGVGITNIKKRLELIYGDKAVLNMNDNNQVFSVLLTIPLNQKQ